MPVAKSGVARRYAEAVFGIARDHGSFDRWSAELEAIARAQENEEIAAVLSSPAVPLSAKESLLEEFTGQSSPEARNLVALLLRKGRFSVASQIFQHYTELVNEYRGVATAHVISAVELTPEETRAVAERLSEMTGRRVVMDLSVDPSLLGGIVAQIGDQLIDASVRGRLETLKKQLSSV